jgi:hypothetical protein
MIENLLNIEMASKILLGALKRKDKINTLDYVYNCLGIKLRHLSNTDPE